MTGADAATPAAEDPPLSPGETLLERVVVQGRRLRGAARGDVAPDFTFDAETISSFGASNIAELLQLLEPQIGGASGGAPVTLLNGQRISGLSEIRDIPPEAIERFEILPGEVALRYGFRVSQRVVNIVLRERFRSLTAELDESFAAGRDWREAGLDTNVLRISRDRRTSFDFEVRQSGFLLESERSSNLSLTESLFDLRGNVLSSSPGREVDPRLSVLAGFPVTIAGVPAEGAARALTLGEFVATANRANITDFRPYRSLLPETERVAVGGALSRNILPGVSFSLNGRLETSTRKALLGLATAELTLPGRSAFSPFAADTTLYRAFSELGPLARESESWTAHIGASARGYVSEWRWEAVANLNRQQTETELNASVDAEATNVLLSAAAPDVNRFAPLNPALIALREPSQSRSLVQEMGAELVMTGPIASLPGWDLQATLKLAINDLSLESSGTHPSLGTELSRTRGALEASFGVPLNSHSHHLLPLPGRLSMDLSVGLQQLSDFGELSSYGVGLNWSPVERLDLTATVSEEQGAPTVQQLGDPVLITPNVRILDFLRGETLTVEVIEGGQGTLTAEGRHLFTAGASFRPFKGRELTTEVKYSNTRTGNLISAFPLLTPEVELAFPDRVIRSSEGRLVSVDIRPVNLVRSHSSEVRYGFSFFKQLGERSDAAGRAASGPPPLPRRRDVEPGETAPVQVNSSDGTPRSSGEPSNPSSANDTSIRPESQTSGSSRTGPPAGLGQLILSAYHTVRLEETALVREGGPTLDFLNGSALGGLGGRPRHEIDLQVGGFRNGRALFINARWRSGSSIRSDHSGDPDSRGSDLIFSDITTINLRTFIDLDAQPGLRRVRWLRGARFSATIDNLFNDKIEVRDRTGSTPLAYQSDYLDPKGRTIRIGIRKLFSPAAGTGTQRVFN